MATRSKKRPVKKAGEATRKKDITRQKKPGMISFRPTVEQRQQVEVLVGIGLTNEQIATVILSPRTKKGISDKTLRKHFPDELVTGRERTYARVVGALIEKATSVTHPQAAICAMFYLKCKHGWRQEDKLIHELDPASVGVLLAPARRTPEEWIREQRIKNETRKSPGERNGTNGAT